MDSRTGAALRALGTGAVATVAGAARSVGRAAVGLGRSGRALARRRAGEAGREGTRALARVAQTPVDALLMLGGRVLSAVQTLAGLEVPGRVLTDVELARVRPVFGDALDYRRVRLKEGRVGLLGVTGRAFAHGSTVYVPRGALGRDAGLLVHELVHVWQHQHGGTAYLSAALWAQAFGEGYDWRRAAARGSPWARLNPEQQAELVSDAFEAGAFGGEVPTRPARWSDAEWALLCEALVALRRGEGAP